MRLKERGIKFFAFLGKYGIFLAMDFQISARQIQKMILAPVMQQSIEVLMLPLPELHLSIEQELQSNPLLEAGEDGSPRLSDDEAKSDDPGDKHETQQEKPLAKADGLSLLQTNPSYAQHFPEDEMIEERPIKTEVSLEDHLHRQLRIESADSLTIEIGEHIIGNLNEDGYLTASCEEIAALLGIQDIQQVEAVLKVIQDFEPPGIACRTLQECLLNQIKNINYKNKALLEKVIGEHLDDLGNKKFQEIAKKTGVSLEEVKEVFRFIGTLEPRPARNHRPVHPSIYIKPDIFISKNDADGYKVTLNHEGIPFLSISPYYKSLLQRENLSEEDKVFIQERLKKAISFVKSIEQRGHTLRQIAEYIMKRQKDFWENGSSCLVPLTLKDVAQAIDRNESTVSRAVHNKFMDTPQGVLPMKFFFAQGIPEDHGGSVSSRSVKEEIRELIDSEDKATPLSDQEIQQYFVGKKMRIARRTISKYRDSLKILPSHLRRF